MNNGNASLGAAPGSLGTATVRGGIWNNRVFQLGQSGAGSLTLLDGRVTATTAAIGSSDGMATAGSGTIGTAATGVRLATITGGTLQIGTGTTAARLATDLVNNGAVVFRPSGTSVLSHAVSGTGSVRVAGPGRLKVTGTSSYSGPTEVAGGSLLVSGALGSTSVTVGVGGLLGGAGSVSGPVAVVAGGTLAPGASIESLAVGSLSLLDGAAFAVEIDSSAPAAVAADFLRVTGNLTLAGTTGLTVTDLALTPAAFGPGTILSLINYGGSWNGGLFTYGGTTLADGASFGIGSQIWTIDYDAVVGGVNFATDYLPGGRFVNITTASVPEPATLCLLLAGLTWVVGLRSRRLEVWSGRLHTAAPVRPVGLRAAADGAAPGR